MSRYSVNYINIYYLPEIFTFYPVNAILPFTFYIYIYIPNFGRDYFTFYLLHLPWNSDFVDNMDIYLFYLPQTVRCNVNGLWGKSIKPNKRLHSPATSNK